MRPAATLAHRVARWQRIGLEVGLADNPRMAVAQLAAALAARDRLDTVPRAQRSAEQGQV